GRVHDLLTTSVAHGDVELARALPGLLLGSLRRRHQALREQIEASDHLDPHVTAGRLLGEPGEQLLQHLEVRQQLVRGSGEVLPGEQPGRHHGDLQLVGPVEELLEPLHPVAVGLLVAGETLFAGVATMTVEDHADVTGQPLRVETGAESALVYPVEEAELHQRTGYNPVLSRSAASVPRRRAPRPRRSPWGPRGSCSRDRRP